MKYLSLLTVVCLALVAGNVKACDPVVAAAFSQAALVPVPVTTTTSVTSFAPAFVPRVSCPSFATRSIGFRTVGFNSFAATPVVGGNTIIQSGRRNVIRGGGGVAGFNAAAGLRGATIIQSGRRNRIR